MNKFFFVFYFTISLLSLKLSAQVRFERSWYYTAVDTVAPQNINQQHFNPLKGSNDNPPFHNQGVYWFKLDIDHKHSADDLIIGIKNPHLDSVFLYQSVNGEIIATDTAGNNFRNNKSYLRYVRFKITGNTATVWLKTHLKKEILFPVTINTVPAFYKAESLSFLKLGIYYGIATLVLIVNLVLYFGFKEPKFLYYSILIFMVALLYGYADGLYALISNNPVWLNYASLPVMLGATIATVIFSIKFLELDNKYIHLFRVSAALLIIMALCFLAYLIFDWTGACILGNMVLPLLLTMYWLVALFRFKKHTAARFFVFASTLSLVFTLNFFVFRFIAPNYLNLMPGELKIANILQMLILSIGIYHRVKKLHKEHAFYREEIQRYLKEQPTTEYPAEKDNEQVHNVFIQLQDQFGLSEREIDVLKLLVEGLTNQQIGEKLYLSANTVKFHIRNIYLKMDINNRAQAVNKIHGVAG